MARPVAARRRAAPAGLGLALHDSARRASGALLELDGETVRVLASSLEEVDGARRLECADGPLWLVELEPAQAGETAASAVSSS